MLAYVATEPRSAPAARDLTRLTGHVTLACVSAVFNAARHGHNKTGQVQPTAAYNAAARSGGVTM